MKLSRCLLIAALPFLTAVLIGWLAPHRLANTVYLLIAWLAFLNILLSGVSLATYLIDAANTTRKAAKLKAYTALLLGVLALPAALLIFVQQPFAALGLTTGLLMLILKNLKSSSIWALLAEDEALLITRYSWVAIGSVLMVGLTYWRNLQLAVIG
ncbi:MAG: hypothetical protein U5M23_15180 [Marinagarivorans sp.]|nr:hypothetical protein [Marinagarivorans sp.]